MPLSFKESKKSQAKPEKMLKVLIALGGRNVSEQDLAHALYPESDGDSAKGSLRTTLFRLRKIIGQDIGNKVIERHSGKISLNKKYCTVDLWLIERLLGQTPTESLEDINQVLTLYLKPFLSGDDDSVILETRHRISQKLIIHIIRITECLGSKKEYANAINILLNSIEVDSGEERFYCALMENYAALSNWNELESVYERCSQICYIKKKKAPSKETTKLYHSLMSKA